MSMFRSIEVTCPSCKTRVDFDAVHSVNADRRPDLRASILQNEFQRVQCPSCGTTFRLDPSFNYIEVRRHQWIAAAPVIELASWKLREDAARKTFDLAWGEGAGDSAREIGAGMLARITFGWPALREKILVRDHELDDVAVEACKAMAMRSQSEVSVSGDADLRLVEVQPERLVMAWIRTADNAMGTALSLPRRLHDGIAADNTGAWRAFKADFEGALFVDLNRLLIKQPA